MVGVVLAASAEPFRAGQAAGRLPPRPPQPSARRHIGTLSGQSQDMSRQPGPVRALDALWVLLTMTLLVLAVVYLIERV